MLFRGLIKQINHWVFSLRSLLQSPHIWDPPPISHRNNDFQPCDRKKKRIFGKDKHKNRKPVMTGSCFSTTISALKKKRYARKQGSFFDRYVCFLGIVIIAEESDTFLTLLPTTILQTLLFLVTRLRPGKTKMCERQTTPFKETIARNANRNTFFLHWPEKVTILIIIGGPDTSGKYLTADLGGNRKKRRRKISFFHVIIFWACVENSAVSNVP